MSDSFLSQEEIDALLNPKNDDEETDLEETEGEASESEEDSEEVEEVAEESSGSGEMSQEEIDALLNADKGEEELEEAPAESSSSGEMSQAEIDALLNADNDQEEAEEKPAESSGSGEMSQAEIDALLNADNDQEEAEEKPAESSDSGEMSQAEIDAILNAGKDQGETAADINPLYDGLKVEEGLLTDFETDALGEIGNISAGSSSTALSDLLSHRVAIDTPRVFVVKPENLIANLSVPYILLEVHYISGLKGTNLLILKNSDVSIISDIMMGGTGDNPNLELDEIRISAISEAMNQMIGSSATAMSEIFNKKVNISPPKVTSVDIDMDDFSYEWSDDKEVVVTAFNITIDGILDSEIFQIIPLEVAKQEVKLLMEVTTGVTSEEEPKEEAETSEKAKDKKEKETKKDPELESKPKAGQKQPQQEDKISAPQFETLTTNGEQVNQQNLNLILDVPLNISVVLGRTKKPINEILSLNPGSIVELGKHANEPVDILVNGALIAQGEVVVVNENYGVKITKILSAESRIRNLGKR